MPLTSPFLAATSGNASSRENDRLTHKCASGNAEQLGDSNASRRFDASYPWSGDWHWQATKIETS